VHPFSPLRLATLALLLAPSIASAQTTPDIRGSWAAARYIVAAGDEHPVQGRIFFSETDWQVLFFVLDGSGEPRRGSAEGGTYTLDGEKLVFTHLFNLSVGDEMAGLPAAELRMVARGPKGAPEEATRLTVQGDDMTLYFPSG